MDNRNREIALGYSPCPNDTYIFHALSRGDIRLPGYRIRTELHDVETLNQMALEGRLDVSKLSVYAWLKVKASYRLLDSGAAMGYGCGPLVVARAEVTDRILRSGDPIPCRVALPGRWTTAHLLFRLWAPQVRQRVFTTYDQVLPMVQAGEVDCGVLIHEGRFTYGETGLKALVDLGRWWEALTGLPVPLGCIAARSSLPPELTDALEDAIARSLDRAAADPRACMDYMQTHAREMAPEVLRQHVQTFVNDFSHSLGPTGRAAMEALEQRARQAGILP